MHAGANRLHNSNMAKAPPPSPPVADGRPPGQGLARLPVYALYGEQVPRQALEALHVERIAERSQRHDWEIQPHRHEILFQILHIQQGAAQAWLDGRQQALQGPCVLWVPALVPHGFVFEPDVQGHVLTVLELHLQGLLRAAPPLAARLMRSRVLHWQAGEAGAQAVDQAIAALSASYQDSGAWRDLALDAALVQLAVVLGRQAPDEGALTTPHPAPDRARSGRALGHVQGLRSLVEAQFRQQPPLSALAGQLGITTTQLNRVCHQVLGHSALGVLHGRLLLEAQRDLAYTALSIKQIAGGLGFADAGYFTRFFQRHAGCAPSLWRQRQS